MIWHMFGGGIRWYQVGLGCFRGCFGCCVFGGVSMVTSQLVPKSTRTLVNSYLFLVNSYLSQLVPKSTRT